MNASEYIRSIVTSKAFISREEHTLCRALMTTMPKEELKALADTYCLDWYLQKEAEQLLDNSPKEPDKTPHNKSWSEYLKLMKDRHTVRYARENLRRGFNYYEWKGQRQILNYFLTNGLKMDRVWALEKILDDFSIISDLPTKNRIEWDDIILSSWLQYRDKTAALIIVKNFDIDTVDKYAEQLASDCGYSYVALRLGVNPDYEIEMSRLSDIDSLYVLAKLHREIDDDEAESLFYLTMLSALSVDDYLLPHNSFSTLTIRKMRLAVWCLGHLGKSQIIMEYYNNDMSFVDESKQHWPTDCESEEFWNWAKYKLSKYFPGLYKVKRAILEDMMARNPELRNLVEKLQLEIV